MESLLSVKIFILAVFKHLSLLAKTVNDKPTPNFDPRKLKKTDKRNCFAFTLVSFFCTT